MASAAVPWPRFFRICRPTAHAPDGAPTNGERAAGDAPVVRPQGTPQQRVQVTDDDLIQTAKQLVGEFKTSDDCVAGGVAAALISASGHVYTGVCVDTACSLGFCAEHAAIAEMLKARESEIDTIVAVCGSGIVPPCGRCRELIRQINATNIRTRVIIGPRRVVTLPELLPFRFAADGRSDREPARVTRSVGRRGFVNEWVFVDVRTQDADFIDKLAELSFDAFREHAPDWLPTLDAARQEVRESLEQDRRSLALLDTAQEPIGWAGVIPHSGGRVWEIHPIAVRTADQGKGYGRLLVEQVERLAQSRGVLTLFVGTSDETGATSLYGVNLYENPLSALATLSCRKSHTCEFWLRVGFRIVGVMPDEEGLGKPGIHFAKPVHRKAAPGEA